jgi:hypothetical protein
MGAVHFERHKRKAAEIRAQAAERTVAVLERHVADLVRVNHEALDKLQIAEAKLAQTEAMADGAIRSVPSLFAGLAGFADQGRKPS